jgi:16S rRNA (cytosine1402-N4)-methyltransferase
VTKFAPHEPVLLNEVVEGLAIVPGETLVAGTFGAGGYTRALLGRGAGRVIAEERETDAMRTGP